MHLGPDHPQLKQNPYQPPQPPTTTQKQVNDRNDLKKSYVHKKLIMNQETNGQVKGPFLLDRFSPTSASSSSSFSSFPLPPAPPPPPSLPTPGRLDDVVIFNFNARHHGVDIWLTNEKEFGYVPKPFHPPNNLEVKQSLVASCDSVERFPIWLFLVIQLSLSVKSWK